MQGFSAGSGHITALPHPQQPHPLPLLHQPPPNHLCWSHRMITPPHPHPQNLLSSTAPLQLHFFAKPHTECTLLFCFNNINEDVKIWFMVNCLQVQAVVKRSGSSQTHLCLVVSVQISASNIPVNNIFWSHFMQKKFRLCVLLLENLLHGS